MYLRHNQEYAGLFKSQNKYARWTACDIFYPNCETAGIYEKMIFLKRGFSFSAVYIMRYEKEVAAIGADPEKTDSLVQNLSQLPESYYKTFFG